MNDKTRLNDKTNRNNDKTNQNINPFVNSTNNQEGPEKRTTYGPVVRRTDILHLNKTKLSVENRTGRERIAILSLFGKK